MTYATKPTLTGRFPSRNTPPMQRIRTENYQAQMLRAAVEQQQTHERLIAAGAKWDGMDGYDLTGVEQPDYSAIEARILGWSKDETNG